MLRTLLTLLLALPALLPLSAYRRSALALDSRRQHGGQQEWQMIRADETQATGRAISTPGFQTEGWQGATVPGTVLTSLVENGKLPDPYYGDNNRLTRGLIPDLATAGREAYTYWLRTEVDIPAAYAGRHIWLEPEGINYRADIWVGGQLVDVMAGMFQSHAIDITDRVRPGERTALAVKVYPVDVPGTIMPKNWGATGEWHNGGDGWIGQNVTQLMTVGWDFTYEDGVRDRNTGIWRSIRLYATGDVRLAAPMVRSTLSHPDYDVAREQVSVEVWNPCTREVTQTVRVRIPEAGIALEQQVTLMRGERREVVFTPEEYPALVISHPRLWWPVGKGDPSLYTLQVTAVAADGAEGDSLTTRFGIREVEAVRDTPDGSKLLVINGHRTFVRGSNWIPEAMLRTDDSRMETEMAYTRQTGINLLRLWGGGIAESDRFYELCDEYGIMVWQEFWMTGDTRHPADEALYLDCMASTVRRIRCHPSVVIYVSSNESTEVTGAEQLLRTLDGTRPYQMQSECDGVHDGSPYKQVNPMRHYENTASDRGSRVDGFNPEYGAPTLPIAESLREMMPAQDLWPVNKRVWDYLDGNGFHLMTTLYDQMVQEYGPSENIDDYARRAQLVGAMNSKSIWEVWNRSKLGYGPRWCSGLLFWYHNSPNPQVCGRMWDYWLEPTASLYHTMHALEPLHAQYDYLSRTVSVVNDRREAARGLTLTVSVYDTRSRRLYTRSSAVEVPADGVAEDVMTVPVPEGVTPVHFVCLRLSDSRGQTVSENIYWRSQSQYEGPKTVTGPCTAGFQSLADMPQARPRVSVSRTADEEGMRCWQVTVANPGRRIAFFNQLLLTDGEGRAIHRTRYTDNFFTLLPGESRQVIIRMPAGAGGSRLLVREGLRGEREIAMP